MARRVITALIAAAAVTAVLASEASRVRVRIHDHRQGSKHLPLVRQKNASANSGSGGVNEQSPAVACPADGDVLLAATQPALTTLCPWNCDGDRICVYYPQQYADQCVETTTRTCLRGPSCAFECLPNPAPYPSMWFVSLYTDALVAEEVNVQNSLREYEKSVAVNASLVTSWFGPIPSHVIEMYITGNLASNDYHDNGEMVKGSKHRLRGDIVPFVLPMAALDVPTRIDTLRVENLRFDQESTSTKQTLPELYTLSRLRLCNMQLDYIPLSASNAPTLEALDISVNEIKTIDSSALPTTLSFLNLSDNAITAVKRSTLPPSLQTLDLTRNRIKSLPNSTLPLTLELLYLAENELTLFPPDIARLPKLEELDLNHNQIGSIPHNAFSYDAFITRLSLRNCSLTRMSKTVENLRWLKLLDLASNDLSLNADWPLEASELNTLYLDNCNLQRPPKELQGLRSLSYLGLAQNPKAVWNLDFLPPMLSQLDLRSNGLKSIPAAIRNCTSLEAIWLNDNPISHLEPGSLPQSIFAEIHFSNASFRVIPNGTLPMTLKTLFIDRTPLEAVPVDLVIPKSKLTTLTITNAVLSKFTVGNSLSKAITIDLYNNRLTQIEGRFPDLESLDLRGNALTNLSSLIAPLLTTLQLAHNNFTSIPRIVSELPTLTLLNLTGNPIRNYTPSMEEVSMLTRIAVVVLDQDMFISGCDAKDASYLREYRVCPRPMAKDNTPSAAPAETQDGRTSGGASVGLVLVNVFLALVFFTVMALMWRRRQLLKRRLVEMNKKAAEASQRESISSVWNDPLLLQHRLDDEQILRTRLIGSGMFGEVWLAHYKSTCVALKRLKNVDPHREMIEDFVQEIKTVATLDHPRIVQFIGVVWTKESDVSLVTEYMEGGDLRSYLDDHPKSKSIGWSHETLQIAVDVAEAIVYLHSLDPVVMHRDLKSRNVLLDTQLRAKLSDFGVSRLKLEDTLMTAAVGTVRWVAPEVLAGKAYDESADIYSLGMILGELDTHKLPFEDSRGEDDERLNDSAIVGLVVTGSLSSSFSESCPVEIRSLAQRCTAFEAGQRPNAMQVAYELRTMLRSGSFQRQATSDGEVFSVLVRLMPSS